MAKKITINDVAQLLRITPETIRFYERKKLITPHRDGDSGYRYFTQADIRKLYDCRIYQSMGFSLAEIMDIFRKASPENLDEMVDAKEKDLHRIIAEDMHALERIQQVRAANDKAEHFYGKFYIMDSPHVLISFHSENGEIDTQAVRHRFWTCVADYYNLFTCAAYIAPNLARDAQLGEKMRCGYTIPVEAAEKLDLQPGGPVRELTPRRCVYTTFHAEPIVNAQVLSPALDWIEKRGLAVAGDILCSTIKITFRDGVESRLYEAWIPVEEE